MFHNINLNTNISASNRVREVFTRMWLFYLRTILKHKFVFYIKKQHIMVNVKVISKYHPATSPAEQHLYGTP